MAVLKEPRLLLIAIAFPFEKSVYEMIQGYQSCTLIMCLFEPEGVKKKPYPSNTRPFSSFRMKMNNKPLIEINESYSHLRKTSDGNKTRQVLF
jgi:hypothetical protein